jgi:hypothetical protein
MTTEEKPCLNAGLFCGHTTPFNKTYNSWVLFC